MVIPNSLTQFSCSFSLTACNNPSLFSIIILIIQPFFSTFVILMIIDVIHCVAKLTLQLTPIRRKSNFSEHESQT